MALPNLGKLPNYCRANQPVFGGILSAALKAQSLNTTAINKSKCTQALACNLLKCCQIIGPFFS